MDQQPFTTDKPVLIIRVDTPDDERITDVNLQRNDNVDRFTVTVTKRNGDDVPVDNGQVSFYETRTIRA